MKKFGKVLSKSALLTAIAASAIVPAAVSAAEPAEATLSLDNVIVTVGEEMYTLSLIDHIQLKNGKNEWIQAAKVSYIESSDGNKYTLKDFVEYKNAVRGSDVPDTLSRIAKAVEKDRSLIQSVTAEFIVTINDDREIAIEPNDEEASTLVLTFDGVEGSGPDFVFEVYPEAIYRYNESDYAATLSKPVNIEVNGVTVAENIETEDITEILLANIMNNDVKGQSLIDQGTVIFNLVDVDQPLNSTAYTIKFVVAE